MIFRFCHQSKKCVIIPQDYVFIGVAPPGANCSSEEHKDKLFNNFYVRFLDLIKFGFGPRNFVVLILAMELSMCSSHMLTQPNLTHLTLRSNSVKCVWKLIFHPSYAVITHKYCVKRLNVVNSRYILCIKRGILFGFFLNLF